MIPHLSPVLSLIESPGPFWPALPAVHPLSRYLLHRDSGTQGETSVKQQKNAPPVNIALRLAQLICLRAYGQKMVG